MGEKAHLLTSHLFIINFVTSQNVTTTYKNTAIDPTSTERLVKAEKTCLSKPTFNFIRNNHEGSQKEIVIRCKGKKL